MTAFYYRCRMTHPETLRARIPVFPELEFCRSGVGLVPNPKENDPGMALCVSLSVVLDEEFGACSCAAFRRKKTCRHVRRLGELVSEFSKAAGGRSWQEIFAASLWRRLHLPVHVVPLGRAAEGGDAAIIAAVAPAKARKQAQVEADVFLRSFGFAGRPIGMPPSDFIKPWRAPS